MDIYESGIWKIVFVNWCQEFVGDCIISCDKECLSNLTDEYAKSYLVQQCLILLV